MRDYEKIAEFTRGPFVIVVDKTWDDTHPRDCFDTDDVDEICRKIECGDYDWFTLRVRAFFEGHEMGSSYLGACCYEDAKEVLNDGTAEDFVEEALKEAVESVRTLRKRLDAVEI